MKLDPVCSFAFSCVFERPSCSWSCGIFLLQGHASKNSGGQAQSAIRTIHMGQLWVDMAGSLLCGMPASAFCREDSQSDSLQALLSNPWFYVHTHEGRLDLIDIPWMNRGSLLWSLSTAMCVSPLLHSRMSLSHRCEVAVSGYILQDLWYLTGARREAEQSLHSGSCTMARQTCTNLQSLCLAMCCIATGKPATCLNWVLKGCLL